MGKYNTSGTEEPIPHDSPSQDDTDRFPVDALLRQHGFQIKFRRKSDEPVWQRKGEDFRQRDALRTIPDNEIDGARRSERLYYEGLLWSRRKN